MVLKWPNIVKRAHDIISWQMIESHGQFGIFDITFNKRINLGEKDFSRNFTVFADNDNVHPVSDLNIAVCLLLFLALVEEAVCKMRMVRVILVVGGRALVYVYN